MDHGSLRAAMSSYHAYFSPYGARKNGNQFRDNPARSALTWSIVSENISSTFSRDRPATSTPGYSGPVRRALPWSSGRRRPPPLLAGEVVKPFALVVSAVTTYTVAITVRSPLVAVLSAWPAPRWPR